MRAVVAAHGAASVVMSIQPPSHWMAADTDGHALARQPKVKKAEDRRRYQRLGLKYNTTVKAVAIAAMIQVPVQVGANQMRRPRPTIRSEAMRATNHQRSGGVGDCGG